MPPTTPRHNRERPRIIRQAHSEAQPSPIPNHVLLNDSRQQIDIEIPPETSTAMFLPRYLCGPAASPRAQWRRPLPPRSSHFLAAARSPLRFHLHRPSRSGRHTSGPAAGCVCPPFATAIPSANVWLDAPSIPTRRQFLECS